MGNLLQLALAAAQAVVSARGAPPPPAHPWCRVAGMAGIGVCILIASGFWLAAAWLFLVPILGALDTALVLAALALLIAMGIALVLRYGRPVKVTAPPEAANLLAWPELLAAFNKNKSSSLLAVLLVGVVAGSANHPRH